MRRQSQRLRMQRARTWRWVEFMVEDATYRGCPRDMWSRYWWRWA